jgi:hypothetical protein
MRNIISHGFTSDRTDTLCRGAAACRRDGQGYMPCPPSMAGRIEVAEGDRNLRGNGGEQKRSRCSRVTVEGDQWMRATGKSDPRSTAVTFQPSWGPRVTRTLFGAPMARVGPS